MLVLNISMLTLYVAVGSGIVKHKVFTSCINPFFKECFNLSNCVVQPGTE